jgi:hypothetical protein
MRDHEFIGFFEVMKIFNPLCIEGSKAGQGGRVVSADFHSEIVRLIDSKIQDENLDNWFQ